MSSKKKVALLVLMSFLLTFTGCKYNVLESKTIEDNTSTTVVDSLITKIQTETDSPKATEITTQIEAGDMAVSTSAHKAKDTAVAPQNTTKTTAESISSADKTESATITDRTRVNLSSIFDVSIPMLTTEKAIHGNEYFNDAVFIGDSVTLGLKNYVTAQRNKGNECLGEAQFLCAGSMSYTNSRGPVGRENSIHPMYKGKEVLIEDGVKLCGAKKVFIMLGMNDFNAYPMATGIKNAKATVNAILDKNPGVKIFIESVTPIVSEKEHGTFLNENVDKFNGMLKDMCSENGWTYVDINSQLKDNNNCLKADYCSDANGMGIHMAYSGCKIWTDYLINKF